MSTIARQEKTGLRSLLPTLPFGMLRNELDNMFTRFGDWEDQWINQMVVPSLDLAETENEVQVTMDVPGMKAEDINIQVVGNRLTISGERTEEKEAEGNGKAYHRVERRMGQFSRMVTLPCEVNETKVEATYGEGVLKIKLPKSEGAKSHKIKVAEAAAPAPK